MNYFVGIYFEDEFEVVIFVWKDGIVEVIYVVYELDVFSVVIEVVFSEGYKMFSFIIEFFDFELVLVEELIKKNLKVFFSFFRVKSLFDKVFVEENFGER